MSGGPGAPHPSQKEESSKQPKATQAFLHRVCVQCNNVFRVPAEKFDTKQCPKCHKG